MIDLTGRTLARFLELVAIDSPSFHEAAICDHLEATLRRLGVPEVWNDHAGPGTGNLLAILPARDCAAPPIAFCAHTDTVEPGRGVRPRVVDGVVRTDGTTVLGGDNKAAVAAIVEVVADLAAGRQPHPRVELLLTFGEERGHAGAKVVDLGWVQSRACFVPDAAGEIGTIIVAAPSYHSIKATIRGRAAHAGVEPEKGVSAIRGAGAAVLAMPQGRLDAQTTANVGLISGGSARNTVPGEAVIEAEARSLDDAWLDAVVARMHQALERGASSEGCAVEIQSVREYRAYRLAEDAPVVAAARRAVERLGITPVLAATGGGADANNLNERGLPSVVLGMGGRLFHTVDEHVTVRDLGRLAALVYQLVADAASD